MKKIRLDLEALRIESFDTTTAPDARGTVAGHAPPHTEWSYCSDGETCLDTCEGTCLSDCGSCATYCSCMPVCGSGDYTMCCPSCYDASCGESYCGTC